MATRPRIVLLHGTPVAVEPSGRAFATRWPEAETVNLLALITGSLGKIALDVMLMASSEFGELSEPFVPGRGASSTRQPNSRTRCQAVPAGRGSETMERRARLLEREVDVGVGVS